MLSFVPPALLLYTLAFRGLALPALCPSPLPLPKISNLSYHPKECYMWLWRVEQARMYSLRSFSTKYLLHGCLWSQGTGLDLGSPFQQFVMNQYEFYDSMAIWDASWVRSKLPSNKPQQFLSEGTMASIASLQIELVWKLGFFCFIGFSHGETSMYCQKKKMEFW